MLPGKKPLSNDGSILCGNVGKRMARWMGWMLLLLIYIFRISLLLRSPSFVQKGLISMKLAGRPERLFTSSRHSTRIYFRPLLQPEGIFFFVLCQINQWCLTPEREQILRSDVRGVSASLNIPLFKDTLHPWKLCTPFLPLSLPSTEIKRRRENCQSILLPPRAEKEEQSAVIVLFGRCNILLPQS